MNSRTQTEPTLGELFGELSRETTTLIRQEVDLAKVELTQKATDAGKNVGFIAAGGAVAYAGLLVLLAAVVIGLSRFIPLWASALIVGVIVVAIGYVLAQKGLSALKNLNPAPRQTIRSFQETATWAKEQVR